VVFDIGGVLEHTDDPELEFEPKWRNRLGMSAAEFTAAMKSVDPDRRTRTGDMNEAEYRERYAAALGLSDGQVQEFMADTWDLYCGELNVELHAYAASLRPRLRTAILSNSADGARREEQARFGFAPEFDPIIYSHEVGLAKPDPAIFELTCALLGAEPGELIFIDNVPANVDAATALGIHAIQHRSTPVTIAAINSLIKR
jgi:putative hydrolase of the HAD superfamily